MNDNSNHGLNFFDVLLIVFIVLKLCGVITWSWIWVLSPLWIWIVLYLLVMGFIKIREAISDWFDDNDYTKK